MAGAVGGDGAVECMWSWGEGGGCAVLAPLCAHPPSCLPACPPPPGWVAKKVAELLGEEPAFVDFVMKQVREGARPLLPAGPCWFE